MMTHDWQAIKGQINIEAVAEALLGPPPRPGKWPCPFHDDHDPSFTVSVSRKTWRCWSCAIGGDAVDLAMRLDSSLTFPGAVAKVMELAGLDVRGETPHPSRERTSGKPKPKRGPSGIATADAYQVVADAERALWTDEGRDSLASLRRRGLSDETIRAARLGHVAGLMVPKAIDPSSTFPASGILVPWFDHGGTLRRIKIRRRGDRHPKYVQAYSDRPVVYSLIPKPDT